MSGQSLSPRAAAQAQAEAQFLMEDEGELQKRHSVSRATSTQQAAQSLFNTYFSRKFMGGCAILFPGVVTAYLTWWFLEFFDNFFSPVYTYLFGFHVFGLGFITSMLFIFATGVFTSSWMGSALVKLSEYIIRKVPLVKHIYSAAKQVSAAVSPDNSATHSFRECVLIRHPRHGEYAFGFITGQTTLETPQGTTELFAIYVPTNHVYVGDIFLLEASDIIRNNLSVREGIEIVVSVGMALPGRIHASAR